MDSGGVIQTGLHITTAHTNLGVASVEAGSFGVADLPLNNLILARELRVGETRLKTTSVAAILLHVVVVITGALAVTLALPITAIARRVLIHTSRSGAGSWCGCWRRSRRIIL